MKRLLIIVLGIFLTAILCSCSSQSKVSSDNPKPSDAAVSQSPTQAPSPIADTAQAKVNITITPPAGWEPVTGSVLPVQYLKGTSSFMVKNENLFSGKTLDDVVKEAKDAFKSAFGDIAYEGDAEKITIDGKDAQKIVFKCKVSGMDMKYEYVYLFVSDSVYAITFGDLAKDFDSLSADYKKILSDIRFK